MSGEAMSVAQPPAQGTRDAIPFGPSGGQPRIDPPVARARRRMLAVVGLALVAAVVVVIATDPFGGAGKSTGGVADNASATSLTTVKRQSLVAADAGERHARLCGLLEHPRAVRDRALRRPAGQPASHQRRNDAGERRGRRWPPIRRRSRATRRRWRRRGGRRRSTARARAPPKPPPPAPRPEAKTARRVPAGARARATCRLCPWPSRAPPAPPPRSSAIAHRSPRPKSNSQARSPICPRRAPRPRSTVRARPSRRCRRSARSSGAVRACTRSAASRCCCCTARRSPRGRSSRVCHPGTTWPS